MKRFAIVENGVVLDFAVAEEALDERMKADPPDDAKPGWRYVDGQYVQSSAPLVIVNIVNVQFTGADLIDDIYCVNEGVSALITANMMPSSQDVQVPAGVMRVIVEKQVRGQTVAEMPFTATITAADGETPARLSLPLKLTAGFYKITPERLNIGLANPKINAPYRLQFDAIDIDCVGAV